MILFIRGRTVSDSFVWKKLYSLIINAHFDLITYHLKNFYEKERKDSPRLNTNITIMEIS